MKLQRLSVLISAIVIAGSAGAAEVYNKNGNKLDLYGKINSIRYMCVDDDNSGNHSFIHYGFHGETKFNDALTGFGTWEHEIKFKRNINEISQNAVTHLDSADVGIKFSDSSTIDYGRNYGVLHDIGAWTSIIPTFSGEDIVVADNFLNGLANGVLTYRNNNCFGMLDGLSVAMQYQSKNDNKTLNATGCGLKEANGDGYGLSITYALSKNLSAGAAISDSNLTLSQRSINPSANQDKKAKAFILGIKYDTSDIYLAALCSETYNMTSYGDFLNSKDKFYGFAEKALNLKLVAQYKLDFGLRPSLSYLQSHINIDKNDNKGHNVKKYLEAGVSYNFNKNMLTFINYRINLLPKNDFTRKASILTDNILALGMTYTF